MYLTHSPLSVTLAPSSDINVGEETYLLISIMDEAVAKLMSVVENRHKVTLDETTLINIVCDSIPADVHWTELPNYHAGEIYQMCYQELLEHLQWHLVGAR